MAKHRRVDGEPTEIFDVAGELENENPEATPAGEYKPRRYEEYVGEVTRMKEDK